MTEQIIRGSKTVFDLPLHENEAACVTTNGILRRDGLAVMGAGIAKIAAMRYPESQRVLAQNLKTQGNHAAFLGTYENQNSRFHLFSFPTKEHWRDPSSILLIQRSAEELVRLCEKHHIQKCYLPRPGCTNGKLHWEDVKRVLLMDDRFVIVSHERYDVQ